VNESLRSMAIRLRLNGLSYGEIEKQLHLKDTRAYTLTKPSQSVRDLVAHMADFRCESCGQFIRARGHVHHREIRGKTEETYNHPDNLAYLCPSCHKKIHSHPYTTETQQLSLAYLTEVLSLKEKKQPQFIIPGHLHPIIKRIARDRKITLQALMFEILCWYCTNVLGKVHDESLSLLRYHLKYRAIDLWIPLKDVIESAIQKYLESQLPTEQIS